MNNSTQKTLRDLITDIQPIRIGKGLEIHNEDMWVSAEIMPALDGVFGRVREGIGINLSATGTLTIEQMKTVRTMLDSAILDAEEMQADDRVAQIRAEE